MYLYICIYIYIYINVYLYMYARRRASTGMHSIQLNFAYTCLAIWVFTEMHPAYFCQQKREYVYRYVIDIQMFRPHTILIPNRPNKISIEV